MKRLLTVLLVLSLLLAAAPVLADGNLTEAAINFAGIDFGKTFAEYRANALLD